MGQIHLSIAPEGLSCTKPLCVVLIKYKAYSLCGAYQTDVDCAIFSLVSQLFKFYIHYLAMTTKLSTMEFSK